MTMSTTSAAPQAQSKEPWIAPLMTAMGAIYERPEAGARCRRGLNKAPMEVPEMWDYCAPIVMTVSEGQWQQRRRIEAATHHVLTLYAVHQQSQTARMHTSGSISNRRSVGAAARHLYDKRGNEGAKARFLATATANSVPELVGHLRHLVTLLRDEGIALDYVRLFRDILAWHDPGERSKVRRRWGLDFHRNPVGTTADDATPANDDKE
jgi:CRISPR system Cascade subunit CasB